MILPRHLGTVMKREDHRDTQTCATLRSGGTLTGLGLSLLATSTQAQDYPNKPITLLVGLARGRHHRHHGAALRRGRVQDRRPAHHGREPHRRGRRGRCRRGAERDARRLHAAGVLRLAARHHPASGNAPYEPVKGFSPVTFLFNSVVVLAVPADSPAKTMKELHDLGRTKPGGLTFGTPGLGSPSHLLGAKILLGRQGAVRDRALSRRLADDGRPDHRPSRLQLADAVDLALLPGREEAPRAGARRSMRAGRRCPTCRR